VRFDELGVGRDPGRIVRDRRRPTEVTTPPDREPGFLRCASCGAVYSPTRDAGCPMCGSRSWVRVDALPKQGAQPNAKRG
jgi:hypothetical protein